MRIPVLGMDPSLRNWGLAAATLDLSDGVLTTPNLGLIQTGDEPKGKQVRQNSFDLVRATTLYDGVLSWVQAAKVVFVEVPHGSQSAAAMKGYGIVLGVLGSIIASGIPIIQVTANENKKLFTGDKNATKDQMIAKAFEWYPDANWPTHKGTITAGKAEHMADAVAAIHAGVLTSEFQNLMRLFAKV
jgi:Holliday junction resolvasome RuvABC endonuclease subunit